MAYTTSFPSTMQQHQQALYPSSPAYATLPPADDIENRSKHSSPETCKRRVHFGGNGARRNERERNRVKMVNMGFATLRNHVPAGSKNKKMSKVDTLRSAVSYIKELQAVLYGGKEAPATICFDNFKSESLDPSSRSPSPSVSVDSACCSSPTGTYGSTVSSHTSSSVDSKFTYTHRMPISGEYVDSSASFTPHTQMQQHYSSDEHDFLDFGL